MTNDRLIVDQVGRGAALPILRARSRRFLSVICHLSFYSPVAQLAPPFVPSFWILGTVGTTRGQPSVASNRKRFGLSIWPYA